MTRTARYKYSYLVAVGSLAISGAGIAVYFKFSLPILALMAVVFLIPGRIMGFFWRDLFRGLRLLNAKDYSQSKRYSQRFVADIRAKPWMKKLIWLGSSTYSRDAEVLALNNLGAAEINLGELALAREHLDEAVALDPLSPTPFFNLGVLFGALGEVAESERCFAQAARLGYTNSISDKIVKAAQIRLAQIEGR